METRRKHRVQFDANVEELETLERFATSAGRSTRTSDVQKTVVLQRPDEAPGSEPRIVEAEPVTPLIEHAKGDSEGAVVTEAGHTDAISNSDSDLEP